MQCNICERDFEPQLRAHCPSCVRAIIYPSRLEQVTALLDREKRHTHVEAVVRPGNDGVLAALPEDADWDAITNGIKTHAVQRMRPEIQAVEEKIARITTKAEELRAQIEEYKNSYQKRKEANENRRKELVTSRLELGKQYKPAIDVVRSEVKKTHYRLEKVHKRTADAREHLCWEAAALSGLKKSRRDDGKSEYRLNGLPIVDLRDLNGINSKINTETFETLSGNKPVLQAHEIISAAFDNVSRLLGICCHYLSIRLPAEVILPHGDFPHTAILPRDSSYRTRNVHYPVSSSRSTSPVASRVLQRQDLSRPRLLQLDRALPQLQKDDSKAALLFLEGVTLLAYDIAWLCRAQGVDGLKSFTDVCAMGQNLHRLCYARGGKKARRSLLNRNESSATGNTDSSATGTTPNDSKPQFGTHSHASSQNSLAGHDGFTLFAQDSWPVTVHRLTDQLKSCLRQETARAEWHFIDDTEWDEEREDERPVLIGGARRLPDAQDPAMSVLSVRPSDGTDEVDLPFRDKASRGWMKVRGREGDV